MEQYEYKYLSNAFSTRSVLRQVEENERAGWSLHRLEPTIFLLFGSGGSSGMMAVMRRPRAAGGDSSRET